MTSPPAREVIDKDCADAGGTALLIGFGRFGRMVTQVLRTTEVEVTLIDHDADHVHRADRERLARQIEQAAEPRERRQIIEAVAPEPLAGWKARRSG